MVSFSEGQYRENLAFVGGIFTLGGLSECGKTTAGNRFRSLGIRKSKIIHIEHEMMRARGIDPDAGVTPETFDGLYRDDEYSAFREFLFRLIEHMRAENVRFASLESLYRAPFGAFLRRELGEKIANIYIEAPLEDRAYREYLKVNEKLRLAGEPALTYDEVIDLVRKKDVFKLERRATDVKAVADYVIDNSKGVSLEHFLGEIDAVARRMGALTA